MRPERLRVSEQDYIKPVQTATAPDDSRLNSLEIVFRPTFHLDSGERSQSPWRRGKPPVRLPQAMNWPNDRKIRRGAKRSTVPLVRVLMLARAKNGQGDHDAPRTAASGGDSPFRISDNGQFRKWTEPLGLVPDVRRGLRARSLGDDYIDPSLNRCLCGSYLLGTRRLSIISAITVGARRLPTSIGKLLNHRGMRSPLCKRLCITRILTSPMSRLSRMHCCCGAHMVIVSGDGKSAKARYGCPIRWCRGNCPNRSTIRRGRLEEQLLTALQEKIWQAAPATSTMFFR